MLAVLVLIVTVRSACSVRIHRSHLTATSSFAPTIPPPPQMEAFGVELVVSKSDDELEEVEGDLDFMPPLRGRMVSPHKTAVGGWLPVLCCPSVCGP